jgi:hypothetical protein
MKTTSIMATYLVANAAWVVTFGDQVLTLEDKSGPMGRFFADLSELDYCLGLCGLKRGQGNRIALA